MKYIVYKTTCIVNNKTYVGVHATDNPNQFDGYIGNGINIYNRKSSIDNPKFPFHYAVKKYGLNSFNRETLFVYDTLEEAYSKEAEIVTEDFIKRDDVYNISLGGNAPTPKYRTLYQFDYKGALINKYESVISASKLCEIPYKQLQWAIYNNRGKNGFYWSYSPTILLSEYSYLEKLKYYIYDSNGNFIQEFDTNTQCVEFLQTNRANLTRAIKLTNKISGYFITTEKVDNLNITIQKSNGKLNRYSLDGKYIDSFNTVKEAKEKTGLKLCSISQAIRLNRQCNGYRWTRTDTPTETIQIV